MKASGVSRCFHLLSQSSGWVSHVLLTRSPLGLHQCCHWMDLVRLACVRHAASVRPEPGSNSPSRSSASRQAGRHRICWNARVGLAPFTDGTSPGWYPRTLVIDVTTYLQHRWGRSPALAFFVLSSVVKELTLAEHTHEAEVLCSLGFLARVPGLPGAKGHTTGDPPHRQLSQGENPPGGTWSSPCVAAGTGRGAAQPAPGPRHRRGGARWR